MIQVMFELARYHAPSTIFLDELDALASHRDASGEHEGSRRLKAELLIQLDGLAHSEDRVFLLAASNLPWQVWHMVTHVPLCMIKVTSFHNRIVRNVETYTYPDT
jgi:katanin p60 ATPase-containing subunit A1